MIGASDLRGAYHLIHVSKGWKELMNLLTKKYPIEDRIKGALAGVALGDSMGMPTEFLSRRQIQENYGWVDRFYRAPDWHPLSGLMAGSITDDTEQTVAIAEMVLERPDFQPQDVANALIKWAGEEKLEEGLDRMGPSTLRALTLLKKGEKPRITGLIGKTNGAAIRVSPVASVYCGIHPKLVEQVLNLCMPTHFTDIAVSGGCAIAFWISAAVAGAGLDEVLKAAMEGAVVGREAFQRRIEIELGGRVPWEVMVAQVNPYLENRIEWAVSLATKEKSKEERFDSIIKSLGSGVDMIETVPVSIALALVAEGDPFDAICMGANAGADTDSIASITGALTGSLKGISFFPKDLLGELERINNLKLLELGKRLTGMAKSMVDAAGG